MKIITLNNQNKNLKNIDKILSKNSCLIGVFSKSCIHCINMKPEWELLKKKLKKINSDNILIEIDSECLNNIENNELKKNIQGFPCILLFNNGKLIKNYEGERNHKSMFIFFKPYFNKNIISIKKSFKKTNHKLKTLKLKENIGLCKHSKYRQTGCRQCCKQFKKKKTYKKCMKKCNH